MADRLITQEVVMARKKTAIDELETWSVPPSRLRSWAASQPALAADDFAQLRETLLGKQTSYSRKDEILAALIRISRTDSEAVTAVVVCLLPGVRLLIRRLSIGFDVDEVRAELLSHLVARIRAYDLARRPHKIAANLLLDTKSRTTRWLRDQAEYARRNELVAAIGRKVVDEAEEEGPLAQAVAEGAISHLEAALILATRLDGIPLRAAGQACGLSYEATKMRRRRAEAAFVEWLDRRQVSGTASPDREDSPGG